MEELIAIVLEVVLEIFVQLFFENGARRLRAWGSTGTALRALGWGICGAAIGGLSLLLFPENIIKNELLRIVHLGASPIVSGFVMAYVGRYRRKKEATDTDLETFVMGFTFALGLVLVRFLVAG